MSPSSKAAAGLPNNHALDGDRGPEDAAGFPFRLVLTDRDATRCAVCPWTRFCHGCPIPPTKETIEVPLLWTRGLSGSGERLKMREGVYVGVDWDLNALHLRYQHSQELVWSVDESVGTAAAAHSQPVDLASCLRSFTEEETLGSSDPVFCSRCKLHCPAKKRLAIWKLPPILVSPVFTFFHQQADTDTPCQIVHLKRFQFVGNRWVKSAKLVQFPKTGFNPASFMASLEEQVKRFPSRSRPCNRFPIQEKLAQPPVVKPLEAEEAEAQEKGELTGQVVLEEPDSAVVGDEHSSSDVDLLINEAPVCLLGSRGGKGMLVYGTGAGGREWASGGRGAGGRREPGVRGEPGPGGQRRPPAHARPQRPPPPPTRCRPRLP